MSKDYYVTLTGGKNNAGDFLIKHCAGELFRTFRSDRQVIDFDGWKPFTAKELDIVNLSKGLILLGGPALQRNMCPGVYALTSDLRDITVPIITMGIGWYSQAGRWIDTHSYRLNKKSEALLERIAVDGYLSSVRDYHTLNVLGSRGYENYLMTGCPALYSIEHIGSQHINKGYDRIGFSLGVSLKTSRKMEFQMKDAILKTIEVFKDSRVEVVFHHGVGDNYLASDGVAMNLARVQASFLDWLEENSIPYVDISGSAEKLINYYETCDLHVGYRVHAHIFCNSISKASILLNEDGRGVALRDVIGGATLDACQSGRRNMLKIAASKLNLRVDSVLPADCMIDDFDRLMRYEKNHGIKLRQPRKNIDLHFSQMKEFLRQLP
ncbi:polysaccharide pyruvyl transferase family protein [Pseudomonadales bacterium]|nr:polysaccharide pyruvyl transferase family protein [Pseudomonadales bacterium]